MHTPKKGMVINMMIRFLGVLFGILLFAALIFSASTAARLQNEIMQTNKALENAESELLQLRKEMDASASLPAQATPIAPPTDEESKVSQTDDETAEVIEPEPSFVLRAQNGKIGIFTADGYLIQTADIDIQTLPAQDRNILEGSGICVFSKKELEDLIKDLKR